MSQFLASCQGPRPLPNEFQSRSIAPLLPPRPALLVCQSTRCPAANFVHSEKALLDYCCHLIKMLKVKGSRGALGWVTVYPGT